MTSKPSTKLTHGRSLHQQIEEDEVLARFGKVSRGGRSKSKGRTEDQNTLDVKTSHRVIEMAREQQEELGEENAFADEGIEEPDGSVFMNHRSLTEEEDEAEDEADDTFMERDDYDAQDYEMQVDPETRATFDKIASEDPITGRTLADIVLAKLEKAEAQRPPSRTDSDHLSVGLDPKVVQVYTSVGALLSRYKSGSLPKAFKIIPSLRQWARLLALTNPPNWTPNAVRAATRLLISNLKPEPSRVYLEGVVLPAVRKDIQVNGKLNVHLYFSLRKALYKPTAFFKGILFPLLRNHCTLKEAAIIASILGKARIPMDHAAGALNTLAAMDYAGSRSIFIRALLDKKYALPYKVLDSVWTHFVSTSATYAGKVQLGQSEHLPVLWHQSLLVFCERYATSLSPDQRDKLLDVVKETFHPQIGPEIRHQLLSAAAQLPPGDAMEEV